jgi:hypothetical protein
VLLRIQVFWDTMLCRFVSGSVSIAFIFKGRTLPGDPNWQKWDIYKRKINLVTVMKVPSIKFQANTFSGIRVDTSLISGFRRDVNEI